MSRPCPEYTSATLLRHAEAADAAGFVLVSTDLCLEAAHALAACRAEVEELTRAFRFAETKRIRKVGTRVVAVLS